MTPQELKNSILQLAIQGKLVEQRQEEGTAEELYKQIQAEKQALIRKKLIKEEKESPAYDDPPFDIPDSWIWARITDCGAFISGFTPKPEELCQCGVIPYFKVSDMNTVGNELWLTKTEQYLKDSRPKKFFLKNTIVYPKNGGAVFTNKKRILAQDSIVDLNTGGYTVIGPVDLQYIYLYFSLIDFRQCYKGTALPTIDMDKLKKRWLSLPPLAEQKRIVAKIEELLPLIERYEKAWSRLEDFNKRFPVDMQKSILQMAIQGKLVEQRPEEGTGEELYRQIQAEKQALIKAGKIKKEKPLPEITEDEIPFEIPDSWKWVRYSELMLSMSTGPFGSMLHKADYVEYGIPLVNPANIVNGEIIPSSKMMVSEETRTRLNSYILHSGMIVMGRRGEMGRCAVITEKEDGWLCGTGSFFMEPAVCLFVDYLSRFFSTPYAKQYLGGESVGTTMSNLNHTILSKMPVPLPSLAEQKRIVARLKELLPLCERLK